ncbi:MAG: hypothetical protein IH600_14725 [Bacteroidetes bacterium]|nr:hypothetical protein [Bacteroidota bacterium]
MATRISIPFTLPEVYQGLAAAHGRIYVDDSGLRLEYRVEDAVFGVIKSRVRDLRIPFEEIDDIQFLDRWYRRRFVVQLHSLKLLADFPNSKSGRIVLKIARAQRLRMREFCSHLTLLISEEQLRRLDRPDDWRE